jgi:hypothetical protein
MPPSRLRRKAASRYLLETHGLPCAPSTLAKLAVIGGGPLFRRAGRIPLYETADLDAFAASKISGPLRSTSDGRAKTSPTGGGEAVAAGPATPPERGGSVVLRVVAPLSSRETQFIPKRPAAHDGSAS